MLIVVLMGIGLVWFRRVAWTGLGEVEGGLGRKKHWIRIDVIRPGGVLLILRLRLGVVLVGVFLLRP